VLFWIKNKNSKADRNAYSMPFLWNELLREQWENQSHLTYTINWILFIHDKTKRTSVNRFCFVKFLLALDLNSEMRRTNLKISLKKNRVGRIT